MPRGHGTKLNSSIDCPSGGHVWAHDTKRYATHMSAPAGIPMYDLADPAKPRLVDCLDPFRPEAVGWHKAKPPQGFERPSPNDVTKDARGLIYHTDRQHSVHIIEATEKRS
jgi:hypothetical protein